MRHKPHRLSIMDTTLVPTTGSQLFALHPINTLSSKETVIWYRTVHQVFGTPDTLSLIVSYLDQPDLCKLERSCKYLCLQVRSLITHFDENDIPQSNFRKLQQVITNRPEINTLRLSKPYTAHQLQLLANQLYSFSELDFQDNIFLTPDLFKSLGPLQSKLQSVRLIQDNIPTEIDSTYNLQDYFLPECHATELRLWCNHEINQSWLDNLPISRRVKSLNIHLKAQSLNLNNLYIFQHLEALDIECTEVTESTYKSIAETPTKLNQLRLLLLPNINVPEYYPPLSAPWVKKIIKSQPDLQQLSLHSIEIDDDLIQLLNQYSKLEHLVLSNYSNDQTEPLPVSSILLNNPNIKVLCLLSHKIENQTIEHILQLTHLEKLAISIDLDYEYNWENLSKLFERLLKSKSLGLTNLGPHARLGYQHPEKHLILIYEQTSQSLKIPNAIIKTSLKNAVESAQLHFSFLDPSAIDQLKHLKNLKHLELYCTGMPSRCRIKDFITLIQKIPSLESISFSGEFDENEHELDLSNFHPPKLKKFILDHRLYHFNHQPAISSIIDQLNHLEEISIVSNSSIPEEIEESVQNIPLLKKLSLLLTPDIRSPGGEIYHTQKWVQSVTNLESLKLEIDTISTQAIVTNFNHSNIKNLNLTIYFSSTDPWESNPHSMWFQCCYSFIQGLPKLEKLELGITNAPDMNELRELVSLLPNQSKTQLILTQTPLLAGAPLQPILELNIPDNLLTELLSLENIQLNNIAVNSEALTRLRTTGVILA